MFGNKPLKCNKRLIDNAVRRYWSTFAKGACSLNSLDIKTNLKMKTLTILTDAKQRAQSRNVKPLSVIMTGKP